MSKNSDSIPKVLIKSLIPFFFFLTIIKVLNFFSPKSTNQTNKNLQIQASQNAAREKRKRKMLIGILS